MLKPLNTKIICNSMNARSKFLNLMINFNLMKKYFSLCFREHKNTELNYFNPIFKSANFRALQICQNKAY